MPRVAALLAAGSGSRYLGDTHKLLAPLRGRPVWQWALQHAMAAGFDEVIVVTGAADLTIPTTLMDAHPGAARLSVRHNPEWAHGQASSVRVAVEAAREFGAHALTFGLADQPFVTPEAWRTVGEAPAHHRIVVATYDGTPGPHPVRLGDAVWPLLPTSGDAGARGLIRDHPEWVCSVACVGSVADVDTVEDLERWNR